MKRVLVLLFIVFINTPLLHAQLLWGMTLGGPYAGGLFSFNTKTNQYSSVLNFDAISYGTPTRFMTEVGGKLYFFTDGSFFSLDINSNKVTKYFDFNGSGNGAVPVGAPVLGNDGKLYGVTKFGGVNDDGVIFSFDPTNNVYTKLFDFEHSISGKGPGTSLTLANNGKFYGTTIVGNGVNDFGVLFSFDPVSNVYARLIDFERYSTGEGVMAPMVQVSNGKLYGTTQTGGLNDGGTLFSYDITNNTFTKLLNFAQNSALGMWPGGSLVYANNGKLYGNTGVGGAYNSGVLYSFDPTNDTYTKLLDLNGSASCGSSAFCTPMQASDGLIYSMNDEGGNNDQGIIYSLDPSNNNLSVKYSFSWQTGNPYYGQLIEFNCSPPPPPSKFLMASSEVCAGESGVVYTIPKVGSLVYNWNYSGIGIHMTTADTSATIDFGYAVTPGEVQVTAINGCGQSTPLSIPITIYPKSSATLIADGPTFFCSGDSVTLTASGGVTYLWNGGATTPAITVHNSSNCTVTITNSNGCVNTFTTQVTVYSLPTASISTSGSLCSNGNTQLTASGGINYLWNTGENTATIAVNNSGNYIVIVTDANGCTASAIQTLTLNPSPTASIAASGPTTFCAGGNVTLTASGGPNYLWNNGATTPAITVSTSNNYIVTITNAYGCSATANQQVIVNTMPTATITPNGSTTICQGSSVTLTASGGTSYHWNTGETTAEIIASYSNAFKVTVTDANGCTNSAIQTVILNYLPAVNITPAGQTTFCAGNSVILTANGGITYQWSTGELTPSINASASGNYFVTATDANGCSNTAMQTIVVLPLPAASIAASGSTAICMGTKITLTASGGTSYQWNTGETSSFITVDAAGNYSVTVTNSYGCETTVMQTITILPLPTASITANGPTDICPGSNVTLTATGGVAYIWDTWQAEASITVDQGRTYTVSVIGANGCINTTAIEISLLPSIQVSDNIISPACFEDNTGSITTAIAGGAPPYQYNWSNGNTQKDLSAIKAGDYTLTVTDNNNCTEILTVNLTAPPALTINITQPSIGKLKAQVNGGTAPYTYQWDNASTKDSITVNHTGNYTVTITDAHGCIETASIIVAFTDISTITNNKLPEGEISPNPFNETATFTYNLPDGIKIASLKIYDIKGASVRTYFLNPQEHNLNISACDFENGVYFYGIEAESISIAKKKMVVLKN